MRQNILYNSNNTNYITVKYYILISSTRQFIRYHFQFFRRNY